MVRNGVEKSCGENGGKIVVFAAAALPPSSPAGPAHTSSTNQPTFFVSISLLRPVVVLRSGKEADQELPDSVHR